MAPINADVAEVAAQLSAIRLRRNGLAAQRALAGALSTAFIAAAMLVATALRGGTTGFITAAIAAVIATLAALAFAVRHARREWLSLPATARLADTHAHLDERLTTLLALAPRTPPPALRALLVTQVVGARHRWDIAALAPQRLSRWLAVIPAAAVLFAATSFYARPAATVTGRPHPGSRAAAEKELAGATVIDRSAAAPTTLAGGDEALVMAGGSGDRAGHGAPQRERSAGENMGKERGAGNAPIAGAAAAGELDTDAAPTGLAELRQSIREAFGAPPERDLEQGSGSGHTRQSDSPAPTGNREGTDTARAGEPSAGNGGRQDTASDRQSSPGNPQVDSPRPSAPGANQASAENGRGSGRGGAGTSGAQGVLGASGAPRMAADPAAPVAIKLAAISGVSPSQSEPQRRTGSIAAATSSASRSDTGMPDLANEQLADVTMQQLDVGPEHEAVVRRLFTRE